jgi:Amylo-alpha-1,6-glucosidase/Glycogen debranching enzyme N terminal
MHPDGAKRIVEFEPEPWPKWIFALEDGTKIQQEVVSLNGASIVALSWRVVTTTAKALLTVRPFLSGRDYHAMHHENSVFQFRPRARSSGLENEVRRRERDGGYHQGTVWPWLIGPFVEAWVRARGGDESAKHEARLRFVAPLLEHLNHAGLGHVSEIADADQPHTPRGCPFQAWSLAELLRLDRVVLAGAASRAQRTVERSCDI